MTPLVPRRFYLINLRGVWTLYRRGLVRFLRLSWHSIGGPCVSSLLFLAVFMLAAGQTGDALGGLGIGAFIAPGVVLFSLCQGAYEGAAFNVLEDKLEGMMGDILAAPLVAGEILFGYVLPAASMALLVSGLVLAMTALFVDLSLPAPLVALGFAALIALLFAQFGALAGLWADRWEQYSLAENFVVLPLGFLSGTFFSLAALPDFARAVVLGNPVFHAVNGFRYGLTGYSEGPLLAGALVLVLLNTMLGLLTWRLFAAGYKLKP